jgi:hypothetical protein
MVTVFATALVLGSAVVGQARERTTLFVPSQPLPGGGQVPGVEQLYRVTAVPRSSSF